jgi:ADP-heptose:LPS heptosyltransferase
VGDFVLGLPALEALQSRQPSAEFTLVGYPSTLDIARDFVNVSAIYSIDVEPWRHLFHSPIPGLSFDQAIVWMKTPTVAENLRASGIHQVLHAEPFPVEGHAARHLLDTLGLPWPELPDRWQPDSDRIVLHPGSGSPGTCWPYFRQLAERLASPVFLLGPLETAFETGRCPRLTEIPLRRVAEVLGSCRAFIGNDSGITHLAAHLGTPTISLFGPTDPAVWGPIGRRVTILKKPDLTAITVDDILRELEML